MRRRNEAEGFENREEEMRESDRFQSPSIRGSGELTVIAPGARLEGNLVSASSLRIEGFVKGQITAEGDVTVAPESSVDADIRATNVTIAGKYKGNVTASGTVELSSGAKVAGNLSCSSLVVTQGALFTGQSNMDGGEAALELAEASADAKEA